MFIISHSFCGSGIWDRLSWAVLAGGLHEVTVKTSARVTVTRRLDRLEDLLPHGSLICLTSWCWLLAGSFSLLMYRLLYKAV